MRAGGAGGIGNNSFNSFNSLFLYYQRITRISRMARYFARAGWRGRMIIIRNNPFNLSNSLFLYYHRITRISRISAPIPFKYICAKRKHVYLTFFSLFRKSLAFFGLYSEKVNPFLD